MQRSNLSDYIPLYSDDGKIKIRSPMKNTLLTISCRRHFSRVARYSVAYSRELIYAREMKGNDRTWELVPGILLFHYLYPAIS